MGLVFIKHPEVEVLGECMEGNVPFWEARGWATYEPDAALPESAALKADWVATGLRKGMTEEQLDGMTKTQIIDYLADPPTTADPTIGPAPSTDKEIR